MKKVSIIGSGIGGLSLGMRLQAKGFDVTIYEKNDKPGGHASQFKEKGYTFDMGPSIITAPDILDSLFRAAGKDYKDYLELILLDPFYRVYFHDNTILDYSGDPHKMKAQMAAFNPEDAENYDDFIKYSKKIYNAIITDGIGATSFHKLSVMLRFLPKAIATRALFSAYKRASKFFEDFRHRFLFSFHPLFIGGNPFKVPAIYLMISYLEKHGGVFFARGGMYSLINAMVKVFEETGGKLITNAAVNKINIENKIAKSIEVNGETIETDLVISNADVVHTYSKLIDSENRKKWTDRKLENANISMSSFILFLGVKKQYKQLRHHTLILSERYKELVDDIFIKKILPGDFSMYVHVPTRTDKSMAPEGAESIYILVPVANLTGGTNWKNNAGKFADKIIDHLEQKFGMKDLRANIEVKNYYTPADFKNERNSVHGSPWGMQPTLLQSAYFRPHNKSEDVDNLYLVGAGTHPGAGLPGVMLSAEVTEKLILNDYGGMGNERKINSDK